ncbi:MAG: heme-binding protein, partial [Trebonia sp.]|uniref:GlcG/HbpS family heme-binding protein n=1 Tax=Trebonia sp. TaxID=2767075 RepID=UPI003C72034A
GFLAARRLAAPYPARWSYVGETMTLPFADARILADGARALALETGKALSLAVVDYGGFVVLVERMDGARPMTPSIALSKAYSAAVMQRPTSMLENWRNSDPVFFTQVGRMGQHPIVATKGGYTLKRDGEIVGGLGISGGSPDEDQKICEDVLRSAGFDLDFPEWAGTGSRRPH